MNEATKPETTDQNTSAPPSPTPVLPPVNTVPKTVADVLREFFPKLTTQEMKDISPNEHRALAIDAAKAMGVELDPASVSESVPAQMGLNKEGPVSAAVAK